MAKPRGLGRGLSALIQESHVVSPDAVRSDVDAEGADAAPSLIDPARIEANPWQPRQEFDPEPLDDLIASIREHGVLQPLVVRKQGEGYQLIAGERRLRASRELGLEQVPVVVRELSDQQALEIALIENLQRENLNPVEEAEGYRALAENFGLTQEQISERVGKGRTTVANALRTLALPEGVLQLLRSGGLSSGHAKALLGLSAPEAQVELAARTAAEGLSVRAVEAEVAKARKVPRKPRTERPDIPTDHLTFLNDRLQQHLGTGTRLTSCRTLANGKKVQGKLEIDFYSSEDLDRLLGVMGIPQDEF